MATPVNSKSGGRKTVPQKPPSTPTKPPSKRPVKAKKPGTRKIPIPKVTRRSGNR
jgi:hypothetical protein